MARPKTFAAVAALSLALSGCAANAEELSAGTLPFPTEPSPAARETRTSGTGSSAEADTGPSPAASSANPAEKSPDGLADGSEGGGTPIDGHSQEATHAATQPRNTTVVGTAGTETAAGTRTSAPAPAGSDIGAGVAAPAPAQASSPNTSPDSLASGLAVSFAADKRADGETFAETTLAAYATCVAQYAYSALGSEARAAIARGDDADSWPLTDAEEDALDTAEDHCEDATGW